MFIPTEHYKNSSLDLDAFRDIKKTKPEDQQRGVCRSMCFFFFFLRETGVKPLALTQCFSWKSNQHFEYVLSYRNVKSVV